MHVTLHLTRACNMRCGYCYAPPVGGPAMSEETGRRAMDLAASRSASAGVVFFGGEPLLAPDLIRSLVAYGRRSEADATVRFHYKITTNGLALDEAFLEFAARERVAVAMSFDGVREAHDAHRRLPDGTGSFDRLLPVLRRLVEAKPYSSVIMVVNPDTVRWMTRSVEFLLDESVRYLIVALNYAADWTEEGFRELDRQYRRLARRYVRWTRAGRKFYFSPFEVKISAHIAGGDAERLRCDLGARQLSVDPDGYVYPCVQFPKAGRESPWCLGHVAAGIGAPRMAVVREAARTLRSACGECALEPRCLKTCACLNWQATGSPTEISPVLCRHERIVTPIADRAAAALYRRRDRRFIAKHYDPAYPLLSWIEDHLSGA